MYPLGNPPYLNPTVMSNCDVSLLLVKQTSVAKQEITLAKVQREVHVVVKNQAFLLQIELRGRPESEPTFLDYPCTATLVYDTNDLKPVDSIKSTPLDYQITLDSNPSGAQVEVRISALSSKHENALFRVLLECHSKDSEKLVALAVSEPIKVISRVCVLRKQQRRQKKRKYVDMTPMVSPNKDTAKTDEPPNEISNLLEQILQTERKHAQAIQELSSGGLCSSLSLLLQAYSRIPPGERLGQLEQVSSLWFKSFLLIEIQAFVECNKTDALANLLSDVYLIGGNILLQHTQTMS